ncbi:hypothetical protein WSM22_43420 [Cytophagales bacterium WSM2-2]|nr:hypothetical protein WSM22_43420 [Cytophagales bacterium WSM2-2]
MMRPLLAILTVMISFLAKAQTTGDFRSFQSGNWNQTSTWERFNGTLWINPAPSTPTSTDGVITIMDAHTVTVTANVTVDQIEWDNSNPFGGSSGSLIISSGVIVTVNNGTGDDIRIINDFTDVGLLQVDGTLSLSNGATIVDDDYGNLGAGAGPVSSDTYKVTNGGIHIHTTGSGVAPIPAADWQSGSTCRVDATSGTVPAINAGITFHHFTWNGTGQTATMNLTGSLSSVNGDFIVTSTNGSILQLGTTQAYTLNLGRDFLIQGNSRVQLTSTGNPVVLNVGRDFSISSTSGSANAISFGATGATTINVTGNFSKSNGAALNMLLSTNGTGSSTLNLQGNFSITGGTLTRSSGTGPVAINFNGSSTSSFTNSATISGGINFVVGSSKTLNLGTSAITGSGNFTLNGKIGLGSTDASGALQASPTSFGNVQNTGSRTYASNSTIIYNGTGAQFTGADYPVSGDVNLTINNGNGVTLTGDLTVGLSRILSLTSGSLTIGPQTLTLNGTVTGSGNIIGGSSSNLTIGGTGNFGTLAINGNQLNNFTLNRTSSGLVTLGNSLTILGTFTHTSGVLSVGSNNLTISGAWGPTSPDDLAVTTSSTITVDGSGTVPTDFGFDPGSTALGTLTLNRSGATLGTTSSITITNLNLTSGTFSNGAGITMATGGTITRVGGSMTTSPNNTTNSYNVTYTSGSITTGSELPSNSTALANLSKTGSGTLTLGSGITVNGILTLSSGSFAAGANAINLKGNFVSSATSTLTSNTTTFSGTTTISGTTPPTFNAVTISGTLTPSINIQINGNLVNNGTLNAGSATTTFGGTTAISGSNAPAFNNLIINGTLTTTGSMSIAGTLTQNSGSFSASSGSMTVGSSLTLNGGTFTAPSGSIAVGSDLTVGTGTTFNAPAGATTLSGNLINSGTFAHNNGTVTFNGTTAISGSATTSLFGVSVSGTLTAPGATTSPNTTLNIGGNWATTGTFNHNNGKIVFNGGASAQSVTGTASVYDVDISNNLNVNINGNISVNGALTLTSATSKIDADGSGSGVLTIKSTSLTAGGRIAAIPSGATFSGPVTIERFINGPADWRYLSMPITSGNNAAAWKANFPVTGSFSDPSPNGVNGVTSSSSASIFEWDQTNQTWKAVGTGVSTSATTLLNTKGYSAYTYLTSNFTASVRGNIAVGNVTIPVALNNFSLVPNPYPSPIDWDLVNRTNFNNTVYIRIGNNQYASYVAGGGVTNTPFVGWTGEIATGQAFWVLSSGASNLSLTESTKTGNQFQFLRDGTPSNIIRIILASDKQRDEAIVSFNDDASMQFDNQFDAIKMRNGYYVPNQVKNSYLNISSFVGDSTVEYAINSLSKLRCNGTIGLKVTDVNPGEYNLTFGDLETLDLGYQLVLVDRFAKVEKQITSDLKYNFSVTQDKFSYGNSRFELRILMAGSPWVSSVVPPKMTITDPCDLKQLGLSIDTQSGVEYRLFKGLEPVTETLSGSGGLLVVTIPKEKLTVGNNDFSIEVKSANGCDSYFFDHSLNYDFQELIPVLITKEGLILRSNVDTGNQWYKNGEVIEGATGSQFEARESATYTLKIDEKGCAISANLTVELTSDVIQVFPVPTDGRTNLILPTQINSSLTGMYLFDVRGTNILGDQLNKEFLSQEVKTLDLSNLESGVYLLRIMADKAYSVKVIKK